MTQSFSQELARLIEKSATCSGTGMDKVVAEGNVGEFLLDNALAIGAVSKWSQELLRLYDWRFELAKMEKDPIFGNQIKGLLNQYGREKKAAWTELRTALSNLQGASQHE